MKIKKYYFDQRAVNYFLYKLEMGLSLTKQILKDHNDDIQNIYSIIPSYTIVSDLYNFSESIFEYAVTREILVKIILEYLESDKDNIVIFENSSARKNDEFLKNCNSKIYFYSNYVYHYLTSEDNNVGKINITISEGSNAWQNIIIFSRLVGIKLSDKEDIHSNIINQLCHSSTKIIVDAYDLDGFLICDMVSPCNESREKILF